MRNTIVAILAGTSLTLFAVGCESQPTNTNGNRNTAVVVNTNSGNTNAVGSTNANRNTNDRDVDVDISRADFDKQKERFEKEAKDAGRTIGKGADDLWIWTKTRAALAAADDLRDSTINVDVDNNAVTLTGTVASAAQRTKAEQVAKGIEGVKSVRNQLKEAAVGATGNTNAGRNANTNR